MVPCCSSLAKVVLCMAMSRLLGAGRPTALLCVFVLCVEHVLSCDTCGAHCGTDRVKSSLAVCGVDTADEKGHTFGRCGFELNRVLDSVLKGLKSAILLVTVFNMPYSSCF